MNIKATFGVTNTTKAVVEIRSEKNSVLCGIFTHYVCDIDANKLIGSWLLCLFAINP